MISDFTATAVELYEHEEKEQRKKITSAKHRCNAFPSSAVVQSISPSLLLLETGRVCKSQMFLRGPADDSVSVLPQATMWAYGSWENSCLILQSSMVNRKNIDLLRWQNTKRERNFTTCMLSCFTKERVLLGAAWVPAQTQKLTYKLQVVLTNCSQWSSDYSYLPYESPLSCYLKLLSCQANL